MTSHKPSLLLDSIETIYRHAAATRDGQCCMIAPSPELRESIKKDLARLRGAVKGRTANLVQLRDRIAPGLNDALIYPGVRYPTGTPLQIARSAAADRAPLRGTIRVIVVLVEFSDKAMAQTQQHFNDLFFSTGVLTHGSVREYYKEVTNGLVDIVGGVVGPYQLPKKLTEYANGDSGMGGTEPNARTMARDAATAADPNVDFAPYDNDGDGYVDAFIVIHAGAGAEVTGSVNDIWSHKWVLAGGEYDADGTKVYAYLTVPEDSKIGVCAHELGHLLFGFPDLYDTDYSGEGIGNWCLMAGGSWNGGGDVPAHPSAWCKANQGWAAVTTQTTNAVVNVADVKASHMVYRLWKDGGGGTEYFLVENRQQSLYDQQLPGAGLLVWHVDETISSNSDENHPKVALLQADGKRDLELGNNRGDGGDPYPGGSGNVTLNATTTPNSKSYAGANTCVAVTEVGASGPVMTARLSVKCLVKKKEVKDTKDVHKDIKDKDLKDGHKDVKDKDLKDFHKDVKDKEIREKPLKEFKEFKESKEFKEFKEKDKDFEKPWDRPGGGLPGSEPSPGGGDLETRVRALEERLTSIEPFIDASLRPDLAKSALSAEADAQDLGTRMQEGAAQAKRLFDTPR